jgi:hypothetical protein
MDDAHYLTLIHDAIAKLEKLQRDRESIEAEVMKLEQLIAAAANMLPDDTKDAAMQWMSNLRELSRLRDVGLTDAIRRVLRQRAGDWLTATNVRDRLFSLGFDFTAYSTNPLASISTTLRRMKPEEVDTTTVDGGVVAYRWKRLVDRVTGTQRNKDFWAMYDALSRKKGDVVPGRLTPPPRLADVTEESARAPLKKK